MTDLAPISSTVTLFSVTISNSSGNNSLEWPKGDLEDANRRLRRSFIPCIVILGIFMLIGITGNSLTCYIFGFRMRHGTQNFFIVMLAIFDLLSCTIGMSGEIADVALPYTFDSVLACKLTSFVNTFTALCSIFTLLVIAVDRYRRVHKPHQTQISYGRAKWCLVPVLGASLVFSWPALVVYGIRTVDTHITGVQGTDCTVSFEFKGTIYPVVYNGILAVSFVILTTSLIVMYSLMLNGLSNHIQKLKRCSSTLPAHSDNSSGVESPAAKDVEESQLQSSGLVKEHQKDRIRSSKEVSISNICPAIKRKSESDNKDDESVRAKETQASSVSNLCKHEARKTQTRAEITKAPKTQFHTNTNTPNVPNADKNIFKAPSNSGPKTTTEMVLSEDVEIIMDTRQSNDPEENMSEDPSVCWNPFNHQSPATIKQTPNRKEKLIRSTKPLMKNVSVDRRNITKKTTIMVFVVTIVFILSFVPHLCLRVYHILQPKVLENMDDTNLMLYHLFIRSYFINNVANPFIYGVMNEQFRREVKILYRRMHCR